MKRKILFFVMLLAVLGLSTMQSCKKDAVVTPKEFVAAMPEAPVPAVDAVVPFTGSGQAITLEWTGTATNAIKWDVYFGDTDAPDLVASALTTNSYTVNVTAGGTYYWGVTTIDANKVESSSDLWSFQVNSNPGVPVLTAPANNATAVSKTVALKWTATDPEEDDLTFDVYLGTTTTPGVATTGLTDATYSPTLAYNTTYYWRIVSHDPYGGVATSAVFSFKTDVQQPDYSVFNGAATELWNTKSSTVTIQRLGTSNTLSIFLPLADGFVAAGFGTVYSLTHPIIVNYDPVTKAVTSTKQAWCDSFIDPVEMGPMFIQIATGSTIDPLAKKLTVKWVVSGNAYWGSDYTTGTTTYTMK
jgi:hypothetical protein